MKHLNITFKDGRKISRSLPKNREVITGATHIWIREKLPNPDYCYKGSWWHRFTTERFSSHCVGEYVNKNILYWEIY